MRKKLSGMKRKRVGALLATLMLGTSIPIINAFASSASKDFAYGNNIDAYLHTYVDFLEGPLWITDKVWCNISLNGPEAACTEGIYTLATNKNIVVSKIHLSYRNLSDSYTEKSEGYGGSYAYLEGTYGSKNFYLRTK